MAWLFWKTCCEIGPHAQARGLFVQKGNVKIKNLLTGLSLTTGLLVGLYFLHAQDATTSVDYSTASLTDTNIDWSTVSDAVVALRLIESQPPIPYAQLSESDLSATWWSAQHSPVSVEPWPPLPANIWHLSFWGLGTNSNGSSVFLLDDLGISYSQLAASTQSAGTMQTLDESPPSPGAGSGTNGYVSLNDLVAPDYGTNLWIAQVSAVSNNLTGILSNTIADVYYELLANPDLSSTNWIPIGPGVYGSELTNWTPFSVPMNSPSNLFVRALSSQDDGSGLPIWWQLQYFGMTGIDPNANPAGDGWSNIQKYQNGMDPNQFYTPAAPQGLTMQVNNSTLQVTFSWQANRGNVSQYEIDARGSVVGYVSAPQTTFSTTLDQPYYGTDYAPPTFTVKAIYSNGAASAGANINQMLSQFANLVQIAQNPQGQYELITGNLSPDATTIHLFWITNWDFFSGIEESTYYDVPVSSLANGVYTLPSGVMETNSSPYYGGLPLVEILHQSGQYDWESLATVSVSSSTDWLTGSARFLKNNLNFLLRSGTINHSFSYASTYPPYPLTPLSRAETDPAYEYSGYRYYDTTSETIGVDNDRPVEENYLWRNFAYVSGDLNTGADYSSGERQAGNAPGTNQPEYVIAADQLPLTSLPAPALSDSTASFYFYGTLAYAPYQEIGLVLNGSGYFYLPAGLQNVYGLSILAVKDSSGAEVDAGGPANTSFGSQLGIPMYVETAFPSLATVDYYFASGSPDTGSPGYYFPISLPVPGMPGFSPTYNSPLLIAGLGQNIGLMAWAKQAIGASGKYAYLEQYFDQAYQIDSNGNVTTNKSGFLTAYGSYTPTNLGPAAIVTMPDVDTGQRGTSTVYCISLALDANHNGVMDTSVNGSDNTSPDQPYAFWANNNFDRWHSIDFGADNEQDDLPTQYGYGSSGKYVMADCNYTVGGYRMIPCTRDLEDYARLWICGVTSNLLAALPAGGTVTLSWADDWDYYPDPQSHNPTIDIFQAADTDGGMGYLTNATIAAQQTNIYQCPYIGRLGPNQSIRLNSILFNGWAGNHFIWCGVTNGSGGLTMTIADANSNVLAQTTVYIQIADIKQMYERWTVGDDPNLATNNLPLSVAIKATDGLPVGASAFQYTPPQNTNTPYILFVHGWNMPYWEKDRYAETAFKRLYWQGYQGRFGEFRWPTYYDFLLQEFSEQAFNPRNYDNSESNAWASAVGLLNKLDDLNAEYPGQVYLMAHSMGNVVAGEALRLASSQVVNTYIAMQAAVSAHAYDPNTPVWTSSPSTPDNYAYYWTNGAPCYFNGSAGAGTYVNFFNTNDYALMNPITWLFDQSFKPDHGGFLGIGLIYPGYYYYVSGLHPNGYYVQFGSGTNDFQNLNFPGDSYRIFAYCVQSQSYALGAEANVNGNFTGNQVDLGASPYSFQNQHKYHSGQFRSDSAQRWQFWDQLLVQMKLK